MKTHSKQKQYDNRSMGFFFLKPLLYEVILLKLWLVLDHSANYIVFALRLVVFSSYSLIAVRGAAVWVNQCFELRPAECLGNFLSLFFAIPAPGGRTWIF